VEASKRRGGVTVAVSRVAPDDWAALRDLRLAALADAPYAFSSTHADMAAKPDDYWREMAHKRSTGTDDCTFLARNDGSGDLVGMAGGYRDTDDRDLVHVVAVWVALDERGTQTAEKLVEAVCAWAAAIPVSVIGAYVSDGNDRARRFYERIGFAPAPPDAVRLGSHSTPDSVLLLRSLTR